jgi:hypothetical protein
MDSSLPSSQPSIITSGTATTITQQPEAGTSTVPQPHGAGPRPSAPEHLILRLIPKKKKKKKKVCASISPHGDATPLHDKITLIFIGNMRSFISPRHIMRLQGVQWAEDVVDNEALNKKKSKSKLSVEFAVRFHMAMLVAQALRRSNPLHVVIFVECCIFHKQKAFGEWSDEEDSDDECEICHSEGNRS